MLPRKRSAGSPCARIHPRYVSYGAVLYGGRRVSVLHDYLEELAKEVGASRSVLAERFVFFAGVPPMQYLAHWRMQLAAHLLREGRAGIAEIALQVGYASEAAFSRAYKRLVGVAPALWRQGVRSGEGAPSAEPSL